MAVKDTNRLKTNTNGSKGRNGGQHPRLSFIPRDVAEIFRAVSVLMLVIAAFFAARTLVSFIGEESTEGRVIELAIHTGQAGKPFYYPVVEYFLPDGSRMIVELSPGGWPPAYAPGEHVTVAYDQGQPERARIQSGSNVLFLWIVPIITCSLAGAFALAAIFARWVIQSTPRHRPETDPAIDKYPKS